MWPGRFWRGSAMNDDAAALRLARKVIVLQRELAVARQQAEHAKTHAAVLLCIWLGTVAVALWWIS